jgi:hypothetical protein
MTGNSSQAWRQFVRGHELGSETPGWRSSAVMWVRDSKEFKRLNSQVPNVLQGQIQLTTPREWLDHVLVCQLKNVSVRRSHLADRVRIGAMERRCSPWPDYPIPANSVVGWS